MVGWSRVLTKESFMRLLTPRWMKQEEDFSRKYFGKFFFEVKANIDEKEFAEFVKVA